MTTQFITDPKQMLATARESGFFVLKGFFSPDRVRKVRAELDQLFDADVALREKKKLPTTHSVKGVTYELTNMIHTILFPSVLNAGFAQMWADVFEHPDVKDFLRAIAGESLQMRVDLVRRSTGVDDTVDEFQIPHNWHRDTNGEFTFGIFFDDLSKRYSGGTIAIPGTHWTPFDPIWDFIIGSGKSYTNKANYLRDECVWLPEDLAGKGVANRQYQATLQASPVEMCGTFGDLYFFFNDVYHGRAPNRTGGKLMMSRFGGFSAAFDFKDDLALPAFPAGYPQVMKDAYAKKPKFTRDKSFLLGEMDAARQGDALQHVARLEKMVLVREAEERYERAKLDKKAEALAASFKQKANELEAEFKRRAEELEADFKKRTRKLEAVLQQKAIGNGGGPGDDTGLGGGPLTQHLKEQGARALQRLRRTWR